MHRGHARDSSQRLASAAYGLSYAGCLLPSTAAGSCLCLGKLTSASISRWSAVLSRSGGCVWLTDSCGVQHDEVDLHRVGPMFERHPVFPARINTHFVEVGQLCLPGHLQVTECD